LSVRLLKIKNIKWRKKMKWSEASFADKIVLASNMLAGITLFKESLTKRGIDDEK
jgi:hypothetical protein